MDGITRTIGLNTTACLAAIDAGYDHVGVIAGLYGLTDTNLVKTLITPVILSSQEKARVITMETQKPVKKSHLAK